MRGERLILSTVKALRFDLEGPKTQIVWDSELPGFGLRLYPSGKKSWIVFYRIGRGRAASQRFHVLGSTAKLSPDQARTRARRFMVEALDGKDPVGEQLEAQELKRAAEQREREARAITFQALAEQYVKAHASKRSLRSDRDRLTHHVLPALGSKPAVELGRADAARMHAVIGETHSGASANRCLALVSAIYSWADRTGLLPAGTVNPARGVPRFKEQSRDRWLSREELRRVFAAVQAHPSVYFKAFVWLSLLTGQRKTELLSAKWTDVAFEERILRIPKNKADRPHVVPLSAPAIQLLERMPRQAGNPHIFPGTRAGQRFVNVDYPWQAVCAEAGVQDIRLHDLRRTVGSWLAQSGHSLALVGSILNHADSATTAIYARLADRNRTDALEAHGRALLEVIQPLAIPASAS